MRAAVLQQIGDDDLDVRDDVEAVGPKAGEVRVRIRATGICHSDRHAMTGAIPQPAPSVLGHEGAGEVIAVGEGVTTVVPGDHVIVVWIPPCGGCTYCIKGQPNLCMSGVTDAFVNPRFLIGDTQVYGMAGTGTFSEELVLPERAVVKIDNDVPFDIAALVGCGVITGVGSVVNAAKLEPGSTAVVIGCGGVGISVIQGARLAGAATILAVDLVDQKLEWAREFGATHTCTPDQLPEQMGLLTDEGQGFDYGFEVIGRSDTIRSAYDATRRGGKTVVIGVGRPEDMVQFSAFEFFFAEKTLMGSVYGSSDVRRDLHRLIRLWKAGRLDLERMITRRLDLKEVNDGFRAMEKGEVIRQVIEFA